ncbi:MAG: carboxypeptidase regulatory-like domain-containing protein, partial [Acidobacteriaceae bacterium]
PEKIPVDHRAVLLAALKDELFALETDRLEGRVTPEEYERQKGALEIVLKRALARSEENVSGVKT